MTDPRITDPDEFERRAKEALKPLERLVPAASLDLYSSEPMTPARARKIVDGFLKDSGGFPIGEAIRLLVGDEPQTALVPSDDSTDVRLRLRRSSWENLFRVLEWCSVDLPTASQLEEYKAQNDGEHFTMGNFWAAVQELQRQFGEETDD